MASEPEPVAWRWRADDDADWEYSDFDHGGAEPLYTAPALAAAEQRGREACAKLIEGNEIVDSSEGQFLRKRTNGNRAGLTYAAAIRKGE